MTDKVEYKKNEDGIKGVIYLQDENATSAYSYMEASSHFISQVSVHRSKKHISLSFEEASDSSITATITLETAKLVAETILKLLEPENV